MDREVGVVGVAGPVVADGDQRSAVGDEARVGGGVRYEGFVGAVGRVQVGDGEYWCWSGELVVFQFEPREVWELS